jgi:hypothetical protein
MTMIAVMRDMMTMQQQQMTAQQQQMAALQQQLVNQQQHQQQQAVQQQEHNTLLRESLLAAQQTTTTLVDKVTQASAPKEQRTGGVADFKKLNPKMFEATEKLLVAERWLTDTVNLLEAANIPAADQVKVVKIQLTDVARSWWLFEEAKHPGPITWK